MTASEIKQRIIDTESILRAQLKDDAEDFSQGRDSESLDNQILGAIEEVTLETEFHQDLRKTRTVEKRRKLLEDVSEKKNKGPSKMDFKCHICDVSFEKVWEKDLHVKASHANERLCKICNKKCKTPLSLETHIKFHFKDFGFMCEICSKTFRYSNRLKTHNRLHHSESTMFTCDLCGLTTKFKNNVKRHMKSVHMKLRLFKCANCTGHEYSTQEALNNHLYRYHDVPAPIKCSDCNHGFTFDSELRAHKKYGFCSKQVNAPFIRRKKVQCEYLEVTETGEITCTICSEMFCSREKGQNHFYLKHKSDNKCAKCNIVFNNYTALTRHEKVKHQGYKPFK